jgi:hypothetical protein
MQTPLQITFRGLGPSEAIEEDLRRRVAGLERKHPRITRCHVIVDLPHRHHQKGNHFVIHIDLSTPLGELSVTHDPPESETHGDFKAVIRDAFAAALRQLASQQGLAYDRREEGVQIETSPARSS